MQAFRSCLLIILVLGVVATAPAGAATFTVTSTSDSGAGSLRQAILDANAAAGADVIDFSIGGGGGGGAQTILLASILPTITDAVTIDGTTQPGFAGVPLIDIDLGGLGGNAMNVSSASVTLKSFRIGNAYGTAVYLNNADGTVIDGLDLSDTMALPYDDGVRAYSCDDLTIRNMTATGKRLAVYVQGGSDVRVLDNDLSGAHYNGGSIHLREIGTGSLPRGILVSGNTYTGSYLGIDLSEMPPGLIVSDGSVADTDVVLGSTSGIETATQTALSVRSSDNVLIDSLQLPSTTGTIAIEASNCNGVTVQNVTATGWRIGIWVHGGSDAWVLDNDLSNSGSSGAIYLSSIAAGALPQGVMASGNTFTGSSLGVRVIGLPAGLVISEGTVPDTDIALESTSGIETANNALTVSNTDNVLIDGLQLPSTSGTTAVKVTGSNGVTVQNVTATGWRMGVQILTGSDARVLDNNLSNSGDGGAGRAAVFLSGIAAGTLSEGVLVSGNTYTGAPMAVNLNGLPPGIVISDGTVTDTNIVLEPTSGIETASWALIVRATDNMLIDSLQLPSTTGTIAIEASNCNGVTVQNVTATGWRIGIWVHGGSDAWVLDNDLSNSGSSGAIYLSSIAAGALPQGVMASGNTFTGSSLGVRVIGLPAGLVISEGTVPDTDIALESTSGIETANNALTVSNTDNVLIDGLQLPSTSGTTAVKVTGSNGVTVQNVTATGWRMGVQILTGSDARVLDNNLSNSGDGGAGRAAVFLSGIAAGTLSEGVLVSGNTYTGAPMALSLGWLPAGLIISDGSVPGTDIVVETTSDIGTSTWPLRLQTLSDVLVDGLDFSRPVGVSGGTAIYVHACTDPTIRNVVIGDWHYGIDAYASVTGLSVSCSAISENTAGVLTRSSSSFQAFDNHFEGNTNAIRNLHADALDAVNNYWGAADGPSNDGGSGDSYDGNVEAAPFLTEPPACVPGGDADGDGVADDVDNCPGEPNPEQTDTDTDGDGDACGDDDDDDGVPDTEDNCPTSFGAGPDQTDTDMDGFGDLCDGDIDGDGVCQGPVLEGACTEVNDNCPYDANQFQTDTDEDGAGDVCDPDDDNDAVCDTSEEVPGVCEAGPDNCPTSVGAGPDQSDLDDDGIGDLCDVDRDGDGVCEGDEPVGGVCDAAQDNCPDVPNPEQGDTDGDGDGNACDEDDDGDGICDGPEAGEVCEAGPDNCPLVGNYHQDDADEDGVGDACNDAEDADGDEYADHLDNCPDVFNPSQADFDGDGLGDACDEDDDGDGVLDVDDICAGTLAGAVVDPASGCSVEQSCPCDGPRGTSASWRNHGKYVSCVAHAANTLVELGLISEGEKDAIVSAAGQSDCGKKSKKK